MFDLITEGRVTVVTLNHGKVNAMDLEFLDALIATLNKLAVDQTVEAVILSGRGTIFSAGVDLKRFVTEPLSYLDRFIPSIRGAFLTAFEFPKPLIGAINGHALAGGCVLANCCDIRVAADDGKIGMPELRVGLPLPPEGIEILRFVAAPQHLQRIVTSGKTFIGQAAVDAGLADEVVSRPLVLNRALEVARELTAIPEDVFRLSKQQIRKPVIERICRHASRFMDQIDRLWRDPQVRQSVADYVKTRL